MTIISMLEKDAHFVKHILNKGWKKQLIWVVIGTAIATLALGIGLSLVVNVSLKQLERQPDLLLPGTSTEPADVP